MCLVLILHRGGGRDTETLGSEPRGVGGGDAGTPQVCAPASSDRSACSPSWLTPPGCTCVVFLDVKTKPDGVGICKPYFLSTKMNVKMNFSSVVSDQMKVTMFVAFSIFIGVLWGKIFFLDRIYQSNFVLFIVFNRKGTDFKVEFILNAEVSFK